MKTITLNGVEIPVFFDFDDNQCDGMSIRIQESSFCEHCMELEPYDLEFFDGNVTWCESCFDHPVTEDADAMAQLKRWEKEEKTKYLNKRLRGLSDDDTDDGVDWDGDDDETNEPEPDERLDLLESNLETVENDLADLAERLKKIEDFLREEEMKRRQDVLIIEPSTLTVREETPWVGPDPEDD